VVETFGRACGGVRRPAPSAGGDLRTTLLTAVDPDPSKVNVGKTGRTVRLAEGTAVAKLLA
jgi:hypothetical protein